MKLSYSRVGVFKQCPYRYKLQYIDHLKTIFNCDPANALVIGQALHTGLEKGVDAAIEEYYSSYPIITDLHVHEEIKLRNLIPKAADMLPDGVEHEVKLNGEDFVGYIDLLMPVGDNAFDIYDFKYSNAVDRYKESAQLHLYKYYFERTHPGKHINKLFYLIVPKTQIRQKKSEPTLFEFRNRLDQTLAELFPQIIEVQYDPNKVIDFLHDTKHLMECQEYEKSPSRLCDWCDYQKYCESDGKNRTDLLPSKGEINMLPKNERCPIQKTNYMKGWIYAPPFSGKTTFLDKAPDPLNLNTDGNTKYVTMQRQLLADQVKEAGRRTERTFAWQILKDAIADLEKGSDFETILLDLVEDTYEMCRLYMYDKLGITHESDDSFRAWDKVRTEYLSTIRRLLVLPYNIFLLSHEDTSKDLTSRNGDKITAIKPNINDKVANKLAGMVDFVARIEVNDDDTRYLSFKTNDVIFGGGRLNMGVDKIPLEWDELVKVYESVTEVKEEKKRAKKAEKPVDEPVSETGTDHDSGDNDSTDATKEEPPKRTRRRRAPDDSGDTEESAEPAAEEPAKEDRGAEETSDASEAPKKRTRRRRTKEKE